MKTLTTQPDSDERRRAPRQRTFLRAKISYLDGSISFDVSVTQISDSGARLAFSKEVNLPETFRIAIPQRRIDAKARLVRRDAETAAIAFELPEAPAEMSAGSMFDRIRTLEAENRRLRATREALAAQIEASKASY